MITGQDVRPELQKDPKNSRHFEKGGKYKKPYTYIAQPLYHERWFQML